MEFKKWISTQAARFRSLQVSDDVIIRVRWFLLFMGILAVYLGFQAGDDWYVKEFATYDWARGMGY